MIIKRDPVKDQPEDGQEIFARAIDGENMLGEYGITDEGDPIFISDSTCGMDWSLVECWAPAEWTDAPKTDAVERATIAEENANVALTHSVQLKRERDRAIEERDALGLQLAALRDQGERLTTAARQALDILGRTNGLMAAAAERVLTDALTHGVDVTKEGE